MWFVLEATALLMAAVSRELAAVGVRKQKAGGRRPLVLSLVVNKVQKTLRTGK